MTSPSRHPRELPRTPLTGGCPLNKGLRQLHNITAEARTQYIEFYVSGLSPLYIPESNLLKSKIHVSVPAIAHTFLKLFFGN